MGRQTAGWNAIVGADLGTDREGPKQGAARAIRVPSGGIINLRGIFAKITDRAARVTTGGAHQRARYRLAVRRTYPRPRGLVIPEKEDLIFLDGAADGSSILAIQTGRKKTPSDRIGSGLREGIARLRGVTAAEPKGAAMETITARLGLAGNHAGNRLPELSVVVLAGHLGFGH